MKPLSAQDRDKRSWNIIPSATVAAGIKLFQAKMDICFKIFARTLKLFIFPHTRRVVIHF